jgi:glycosyltransferase involved in cell wall biosynthesis
MSATSNGRYRVLYSFPHPLGSPGIGTTSLHHVLGALAEGHDVTVYCTSLSAPVDGARRIVQTLVVRGRRIPHRVLGLNNAYAYHDRRVASALARSPAAFDVVHTWPLGARSTLATARRLGVAGVRESPNAHTATAYELAAREAAAVGMVLPRRHSHRLDPRRLATETAEFDLAHGVLVPSTFVAGTFVDRGIPEERLLRHQYGFEPARFPRPGATRTEGPFTVAFVGHGEPRKGLHYALEAWRRSGLGSTGARLIVCGRFLPAYREVIADLLVTPGVEVREFTSDVGALLRDCDALVLASVEEGSALVTYEAQASGCVLLVSHATGALMTPGVHGFEHRAGDVSALSEHLVTLARSPELLARMRSNVLAHREALTWQRAAGALTEAYGAAMDRARPATPGQRSKS